MKRTIKRRRKPKRKCSSKQYNGTTVTKLKKQFRGVCLFRKLGPKFTEVAIFDILKNKPHPNIVSVYRITDSYIDMELLKPLGKYDKDAIVSAASSAKDHLQSLGIMYIDWKLDNIGISADGTYKLFDFDVSGITKANNKEWKRTPSELCWTYRQALANKLSDPKEMDDFAFDINLVRDDYIALDDSEFF